MECGPPAGVGLNMLYGACKCGLILNMARDGFNSQRIASNFFVDRNPTIHRLWLHVDLDLQNTAVKVNHLLIL